MLTLTCILTTTSAWAVTYSVAGDNSDIFGASWDASNQSTTMTLTNDANIYQWTSGEFTVSGKVNVEYKVVKEYSWDESWGNSSGGNQNYTINNAGCYTMTFFFNENTKAVYATLNDIYTVAGTAALFGTNWDISDTNNNMTNTSETTWTWTRSNVELTAGNIEFKVIKGHNYNYGSWPANNYVLNIPENGKYDVTITYDSSNNTVTATATKIPEVIYLFGSVGKSEAWLYSTSNPTLTTADGGETYTGVWDINEMPSYTARDGKYGLFLLATDIKSDWNSTKPYMIGNTDSGSDNHYWIDGGEGHYDQELPTAAVGTSQNGWTLPSGTYEITYNRKNNTLKVVAYDGPVIFVYDYTRPYIYVRDNDGKEFNGADPGAPILNLDENVGGHRGLSVDGDITKNGASPLGWYKFAVPSKSFPITFQLHHNDDKNIIHSGELTVTAADGDVYYYWTGSNDTKYAKVTAQDDVHEADNIRRIVAHVRVQGTTVPTCNGVEMNGPSSFYGQMYYWTAVTTYNTGFNFDIKNDGKEKYVADAKSDFYLELVDGEYTMISEQEMESRLANKTGLGTIIHLQKNANTPTDKNGYVLGIETRIHDDKGYHNSTNLGATWWGASVDATLYPWKGIYEQDVHGWSDGVITNYDNSRYIYMSNGLNGNPDVYTITAENGTEWYTWYSDRSTATINFGYGNAQAGYPTYPENESTDKFFATYASPQPAQTAGEVWYVWTPDFDATLTNGQSTNNGTLLDVTRTYESRAKQKAMCSTERDGNYVYYTDIKGWGDGNVYCYVWDKNGNPITPWPGVKMTKVGYDDEGHPVYLADLSNYDVTNAGNVLFNNGVTDSHATNKRQTGDLEWANGGCYDYLGLLYRIGGNTDVIDNEPDGYPTTMKLHGVWYSRVKGTLFAKGDNDYNNKSENGFGYIDFAKTVTDGSQEGTVLKADDYDQSNWVEIYPSESGHGNVTTGDLMNLLNKDFTLYGTKVSSVNPTFHAITVTDNGGEKEYTPNPFTPAHFNGTPYLKRSGDDEWYFFVEPKPNEFGQIFWTIYDDNYDNKNGAFYAAARTGFTGTINVDWSYHDPFYAGGQNMTKDLTETQRGECGKNPGTLTHLGGYSGWYAIIKLYEEESTTSNAPRHTLSNNQLSVSDTAPASEGTVRKYTVYPICLTDENLATAIDNINVDKRGDMRSLKSTRYYNMMGVESATPFEGVNIIVKEYSDGSRESSKAIMR